MKTAKGLTHVCLCRKARPQTSDGIPKADPTRGAVFGLDGLQVKGIGSHMLKYKGVLELQ